MIWSVSVSRIKFSLLIFALSSRSLRKKESVTLTQNRLVCYSMKSYQEYSGRVVSVLDEPLERRERSDCKHPMLIPIDYWCLNIYVNKLRVVSCWRRPMPHDCLFPDFTKIIPWSEMTNSFEWLCGTCCDDKAKDTFLLLPSFLPIVQYTCRLCLNKVLVCNITTMS